MNREDQHADIRQRIADAVSMISCRILGTEQRRAVLGSIVDRFIETIRGAGGACTAAVSGNPNAAYGALQSLGGTIETILLEMEGALTERDVRITALEAEAATAATRMEALEHARAQLQASIAVERGRMEQTARESRAALECELADRDARIVALETLTATTADALIRTLTEFSRMLPERIDAHLTAANDRESKLLRLKDDVQSLTELEHITVNGTENDERRTLDAEVAALVTDIAPIRASYHEISSGQLAVTERLRSRYRLVVDHYRAIQSLIGTLTEEVQHHDEAHRAAAASWAVVDRDVRAAVHLFPRIFQKDPFVLAGTTNAEISQKKQAYADIQQKCDALMGEIQQLMSIASVRYTAIKVALEQSETDIEQLLTFHEASEYEALPVKDQRLIRCAVLVFRARDRSLSARTIAGILSSAGECPMDDAGVVAVAVALRPEFFEPAAPPTLQEKMQVFRLTDRARYWREAWSRDDPALVDRLAEARRVWQADVEAAEAREAQERDVRKTERAAQKTARATERAAEERRRAELIAESERPATIVTQLGSIEREMLAVIVAAMPALRETSYAGDWPRIIILAMIAGAIESSTARAIAGAFRRLTAIRPALLTPSTARRGVHEHTPFAESVAELLPTIAPDVIRSIVQSAQSKVKHWDEVYRERYHAIHAIVTRPAGAKTPDDE